MRDSIPELVARSEIIVAGRSGLVTNTGGSMNVEVEVEEVLKGAFSDKRVRVAFHLMGMGSPAELEAGERYIFMLQRRQGEGGTFFGLVDDSPDSIIPFDRQIAAEIGRLVAQ